MVFSPPAMSSHAMGSEEQQQPVKRGLLCGSITTASEKRRAIDQLRGVPEVLNPACECGEGRETAGHLVVWRLAPPLTRRWERTGIRTRRKFYSVLHGIDSTSARLAGRALGWLMDSGRLPMYSLARRLELEAAA